MTSPQCIAFYGSLMRRGGAQVMLGIQEQLAFFGTCEIPGKLYDLGEFPGLTTGEGIVEGELFTVLDPAALAVLDAYEDYRPDDRAGSLFLRQAMRLARPEVTCWVYLYNRPVWEDRRVHSGRWR